MKSIRNIFSVLFILGGFIALLSLLHAQETGLLGSFNEVATPLQPAQADSIVQLTAEAHGLTQVAREDLPRSGTFWLVMPNGMAPLPCPPNDTSFPVYQIAEGQFLVDATGGTVAPNRRLAANSMVNSALEAQASAVVNLIERVQAVQFQQGMLSAFGIEDEMDSPSGFSSMFAVYSTNDLYLEITGTTNSTTTNGTAFLVIHPPWNVTNGVYDLFDTTNLATPHGWNWILRCAPGQTNLTVTNLASAQEFFILGLTNDADGDGMSSAFEKLASGTDPNNGDQNTNGIPDGWEWKYFGNLNQASNTDYDADGTNIFAEYTRSVDPNKLSFSCSFPNQYVTTNMASGVITILGGVPASIAVLVDSTNFAGATWTAYASSNVTANLGSTQGPHDVWTGLRGLPSNAQPTWQETTLVLDSTTPTISITNPVNNVSFNSSRVNVSGNFTSATLKQITVNGVLAFVHGNSFEALNVPLDVGTNTVRAIAENLTGATNTALIKIITTTNANGSLNNPVQLQATPIAGFSPLPVTFQIQTNLPGTTQQVLYDFNGDSLTDFVTNNLNSFTYTYATNGEFFPVVTVQTSAGRFSSIGGWNAVSLDSSNQPIRINVQIPPVQATFASITDPVDLKLAGTNLYVLSRSTATITEFATNGTVLRSLNGLGTNPSGFDVDAAGNVYVAVTASNQVWKLKPTTSSFTTDTNFGIGGRLGLTNGLSGTSSNAFNAPFDVAVTPDGGTIAVSDSGNHRIQQFAATNGVFIASFGSSGNAVGQFNTPKGLTYDSVGTLYIVDSGNSRITLAQGSIVAAVTGTNGTALGQFSNPVNISIGTRGVYVADTGNNRIQKFNLPASGLFSITPSSIDYAIATNLSQPYAVAAVNNLTNDLFYVSDTSNNRVVLCTAPSQDADAVLAVWNHMTARIGAADIPGAITDYSSLSADRYRQAFLGLGTAETISAIGQTGTLTPVFVNSDAAEYYFRRTIEGQVITFPIEFVKENGAWKIDSF